MTDPLAPVLDSLARYERESCPAELAAVDQTEADIKRRWAKKGWTLDEGAARAVLLSIASQPLYTLDHLRTAAAFARHITRTDVSS